MTALKNLLNKLLDSSNLKEKVIRLVAAFGTALLASLVALGSTNLTAKLVVAAVVAAAELAWNQVFPKLPIPAPVATVVADVAADVEKAV